MFHFLYHSQDEARYIAGHGGRLQDAAECQPREEQAGRAVRDPRAGRGPGEAGVQEDPGHLRHLHLLCLCPD